MFKNSWKYLLAVSLGVVACSAQSLSPNWDELTSSDFAKAIQQAGGVCMLPVGSIEPSGPSQPLGSANYVARVVTLEAVKQEYAVVFPNYYISRTSGVTHLPGTVVYSEPLQLEMLAATVQVMVRNGCTKVVLVNAHAGNSAMIAEFMTADMKQPHDYVVYSIYGGPPRMTPLNAQTEKLPVAMRASGPLVDGHGGEDRTSVIMAYFPSLAHPERAHDEPASQEGAPSRLPAGVAAEVSQLSTNYSGDSSGATVARGKAMVEYQSGEIAKAIHNIKADDATPRLQKEYFEQLSGSSKK